MSEIGQNTILATQAAEAVPERLWQGPRSRPWEGSHHLAVMHRTISALPA